MLVQALRAFGSSSSSFSVMLLESSVTLAAMFDDVLRRHW